MDARLLEYVEIRKLWQGFTYLQKWLFDLPAFFAQEKDLLIEKGEIKKAYRISSNGIEEARIWQEGKWQIGDFVSPPQDLREFFDDMTILYSELKM